MSDSVKTYVQAGETITMELPWSEVCMHMGVAGVTMDVQLTERGGAQILTPDGNPFSIPILPGEAGFHWDADGTYTYTDAAGIGGRL